MNTTYLADAAELATQYPDARPPKNGLPWQSEKLGVDILESDRHAFAALIVRHNPSDSKPSRLVRMYFRDAPTANTAVAVIECVSEFQRNVLMTPIQHTIGMAEDDDARDVASRSRPVESTDIDAPAPRAASTERLGEILKERFEALRDAAAKSADQPPSETPLNPKNAWRFPSLQSIYLTDVAQFNLWFPVIKVPDNILPNRSIDRSTFVFTAFDNSAYFAMLVREDLDLSTRNRFVREAFNAMPDAYAWVLRFDDWMMRDTFALGLQCRLFGSLLDGSEPDDPPVSGDDSSGGTGPRGDGDAGVPAVTIRPTPTRSGSAANDLPEEDEPKVFYIGPEELVETPVGGELAPARV